MDDQRIHPTDARSTADLLGLDADARVLLINCDDFGMYHAINAAVLAAIENGVAASCSLMVPCPWARHAMHLLRERPEIPFGIHLTLFLDTVHYGWGPVLPREEWPNRLLKLQWPTGSMIRMGVYSKMRGVGMPGLPRANDHLKGKPRPWVGCANSRPPNRLPHRHPARR